MFGVGEMFDEIVYQRDQRISELEKNLSDALEIIKDISEYSDKTRDGEMCREFLKKIGAQPKES